MTGYDGLLLAYSGAGTRLFAVAASGGWSTDIAEAQAFLDLEVLPGGDILCGGYDARYADGYGDGQIPGAIPADRAVVVESRGTSVPAPGTSGSPTSPETARAGLHHGHVRRRAPRRRRSTRSACVHRRHRLAAASGRWRRRFKDEPAAIAVNGVNAYVVGRHYVTATDYDQATAGLRRTDVSNGRRGLAGSP